MNFLTKVLDRPENERPFLLLPVGYPAKNAQVRTSASIEEVSVFYWWEGYFPMGPLRYN